MNAHAFNIEALTPAEAEAVAGALCLIADGLTVTAARPGFRPLVKRRVDDTIQHLIAVSDWLSGDADLEPENDDEPYLGWGERGPRGIEPDHDRESDAGDEPEIENEHGGDVQDECHDPCEGL